MKAFPLALLVALSIAKPTLAEVSRELGAEEFLERCASCHGMKGKGDGPVSQFLKIPTPDLTSLALKNGGEFPFERAYRVIDGRDQIPSHGTRKMPIWGYEYRQVWKNEAETERQTLKSEDVITGRILSLIRYLESIQIE